jgi:uncharacterized protein YndB with AHSA1/START domain
VGSTCITRLIKAPRAAVYRALIDPAAIAVWKVPTGMTSKVHAFEAREGGAFRVSLTYTEQTGTGKTTAHTDTYHGHFAQLIPNERIVEVVEFETSDPELSGEMRITTTLADAVGGTSITALHDNLPEGVSPKDNEIGWSEAFTKLAAFVEGRQP